MNSPLDLSTSKSQSSTAFDSNTFSPKDKYESDKKYINEVESVIPEGYNRLIPVVFATDDSYAPYCSVAIASIIQNASPVNYYRIYIFHTGLSDSCIGLLEEMSVENCAIRCLNIQTPIDECKACFYRKGHFSKEMFYRLLIPSVLDSFEQVAYLDADLVVTVDVASIFQNLGGQFLPLHQTPLFQ